MIKKVNFILLTLLIIFTNINKAYATDHYPWTYGDAATLKIIIRKLELCTGFQEGGHSYNIRKEAFCNDAVVIGEGDQEYDITSVEPGMSIGSYGDTSLLPMGETYTHIRLTLDKKFVMKNSLVDGKGLDTGSSDTSSCNTKKITDDMYGNSLDDNEWQRTNNYKWTEARNKYGTMVSYPEDENGIPEETNVYMIDGTDDSFVRWQRGEETWEDHHWTHYHCYGLFCKSWGWWDRQYGNDGLNKNSLLAGSAVAMSIPRSGDLPAGGTPSTNNNFKNDLSRDSTDDLIFVIPLKKRYKIKSIPPTLELAFNTKEAIMVFESYNGANTGQCPESAKVNGVCEIPNQKGMCTFGLGKVAVEIKLKNTRPNAQTYISVN
jgi:hypothetical protein